MHRNILVGPFAIAFACQVTFAQTETTPPSTNDEPGTTTAVKADDKCLLMLETYKEQAIRALQNVENSNLKGLLRRVLGKIFNDLEIKGWCREYEVKNGVREDESVAPATEDEVTAVAAG